MRPPFLSSCLLVGVLLAGVDGVVEAAPVTESSHEELEAHAGVEHWARYYGYAYPITGALREYVLEGAPAMSVDLSWLPIGVLEDETAHFGFRLGHSRLLRAVSRIHDSELATDSQSWRAGFRTRFDTARWLETTYDVLYGDHSYTVADTYVPDPHYRFVRTGMIMRLELWRVVATAGAGLRFVLDTGDLQSGAWYPDARGLGYDAELTCGILLLRPLALVIGVRWQYYRFNLMPNPFTIPPGGSARVAFDLYLDTFGRLELRL